MQIPRLSSHMPGSWDSLMQSVSFYTGADLSVPSLPAPGEHAAGLPALPSLPGSFPVQNASFFMGIPTPRTEIETEADQQEIGLHQNGENNSGWDHPDAAAYLAELFGEDLEPAMSVVATDATTCSVASPDAVIMDEDDDRAMGDAADDATTSSEPFYYDKEAETGSISPLTSDGKSDSDLNFDISHGEKSALNVSSKLSSSGENLFSGNLPQAVQEELERMARLVAENPDLIPDTQPWDNPESVEYNPAAQNVADDDLPDTEDCGSQVILQSPKDNIAVSYEMEDKPFSDVQEKISWWRHSLGEEPASGGPDQ
ncbi:hypothetical protein FJTKL_12435 [Diaporthe vaccinii]|uniref:Uncharacterized protein n=1 Tax=Diaporthe vaccinii TaxID=105482 RepID=A0ABR4EDY3_9PEZI